MTTLIVTLVTRSQPSEWRKAVTHDVTPLRCPDTNPRRGNHASTMPMPTISNLFIDTGTYAMLEHEGKSHATAFLVFALPHSKGLIFKAHTQRARSMSTQKKTPRQALPAFLLFQVCSTGLYVDYI